MLAPPCLGHCSNELELTRAPATAKDDAGDNLGHPGPNRHHPSMHEFVRIT